MELLTALGLSSAAGLNAYIPLLLVGLLSRYTALVDLPTAWRWLDNPWTLVALGVLLTIEVVADKVPVVDHVNDLLQTVVRPTSGGLVVGAAGLTSDQATITDPGEFVRSGAWVPIVIGIATALAVHVAKSSVRGAANAATLGIAAPFLSTAEDATSVGLTFVALLLPLLVLVMLAALVYAFVRLLRRRKLPAKPVGVVQ